MITCRTPLTRRTIRALAAFHAKKSPKSILISVTGGCLFLLSLINAFGLWMKYYGNASLLFIFSKSAVLILLSLVLLYTGIRGKTQKLYLELKGYFSETKSEYIDYIISDTGITMILNGNQSFYPWDTVESMESDSRYFYFTCSGRHILIDKSSFSQEDESILKRYAKDSCTP